MQRIADLAHWSQPGLDLLGIPTRPSTIRSQLLCRLRVSLGRERSLWSGEQKTSVSTLCFAARRCRLVVAVQCLKTADLQCRSGI